MAASGYVKLIQALWNALRTDSALSAYRLTLNPTSGGRDFDVSAYKGQIPRDLPLQTETPGFFIWFSGTGPAHGSNKQWIETIHVEINGGHWTENYDEIARLLELTKEALMRKGVLHFADGTSPSLSFPSIQQWRFGDTTIDSLIENETRWTAFSLAIDIDIRFQVN